MQFLILLQCAKLQNKNETGSKQEENERVNERVIERVNKSSIVIYTTEVNVIYLASFLFSQSFLQEELLNDSITIRAKSLILLTGDQSQHPIPTMY